MLILGIESSCDETAAAIVKDGREVLANVVSSQIKIHEKFGGVVPEVAAREHLNSINLVIKEAYEKADIVVFLVNHREFAELNYRTDVKILDFCGTFKK